MSLTTMAIQVFPKGVLARNCVLGFNTGKGRRALLEHMFSTQTVQSPLKGSQRRRLCRLCQSDYMELGGPIN